MSVYIVNGAPTAGKTTFETYVKQLMGDPYCKIISSIDLVKTIARHCGWSGDKTPESRKFLSDLKRTLTDFDDIPHKSIRKQIKSFAWDFTYYGINYDKWAVFVDCREPEEIARLCEQEEAKSILVSRMEAEQKETSNRSDSEVLNYDYDIVIENNGDLRALAESAIEFIQSEGLHMVRKPFMVDFFGKIKFLEEDEY